MKRKEIDPRPEDDDKEDPRGTGKEKLPVPGTSHKKSRNNPDEIFDYVLISFVERDYELIKDKLSKLECQYAVLCKIKDVRIHSNRIRGYFLLEREIDDIEVFVSGTEDCKVKRFSNDNKKYSRYANVNRVIRSIISVANHVDYMGSRDKLYANKAYCGKPYHVCNCEHLSNALHCQDMAIALHTRISQEALRERQEILDNGHVIQFIHGKEVITKVKKICTSSNKSN